MKKSLLCVILALGCGACATKIPYDRTETAGISRIAIIGPENPTHYALQDDSPEGILLGRFNGPPEVVRSEIDDAVVGLRFDLGNELCEALSEALQNYGYQVVIKSVPHPKHRLLDRYDTLAIDADAILDVSIDASGFDRRPWKKQFTPALAIRVRLVEKATQKIRFEQLYVYSDGTPARSAISLQPGDGYSFSSVEEMAAERDRVVRALRAPILPIASLVGAALAR